MSERHCEEVNRHLEIVQRLVSLFPHDRFSTHPDHLSVASHDESSSLPVVPIAVLWPLTSQEISDVVKLCAASGTPITARGAGSALEGSTVPLSEGIVLDLSRMNHVVNLWPDDLQVEVEPGIIYDQLNERLKREGLFFPPSPGGSGDVATVGGMVSTNASGIYSVKYGGTREYVLALTVVTGSGEILRLGSRAIKRSSGYNLTDLICGSEGTLAIVTGVTLKLEGIPEHRLQAAYRFDSEVSAAKAVSDMRRCGLDLAAIEFLDRRLINALNRLKDYRLDEVPCLFLEFHGPQTAIDANASAAEAICIDLGGASLTLAEGHRPWEIRHWATDAVKHFRPGCSIIRNDVAFPISRLPEIVEFCYHQADREGVTLFTFGHVGMGLLHALMIADKKNTGEWEAANRVNDLIIRKSVDVGGSISGEHGIGIGHKELFQSHHHESIELMRQIKRQFDPSGILNPGKIFD